MRSRFFAAMLAAAGLLGGAGVAHAEPKPWEIYFQPPASPVMERVESFHDLLLWITIFISLFVLFLLFYVAYKFRADKNPVPSRRSHHALLEVVWTGVPALVLVLIAVPSLKLLYLQDVVPESTMTIKATGNQWYWSYVYPDNGNFTFDANLVGESDLKPGQPRLLQTDNELVLPVGENIRVQITASDVLHSWAMPQMGVKMDAVPGRLNETWVHINEPGMYYGQCSELCGQMHGYMPITIRAVTRPEFDAWATQAKAQFASADPEGAKVGAAVSAVSPAANVTMATTADATAPAAQ